MRLLVACPSCCRQFDASGRAPGERLACSCGATVPVPAARPHDAAVVRCSACGAPRQEGAATCAFCGSAFTLHDRDLDTLCPGCMARVSGKGRFCHHCAAPLLFEQAAAPETDLACPACCDGARLGSRRIGRLAMAAFECGACGGLWLDRDAFRAVAERARSEAPPPLPARVEHPAEPPAGSRGRPARRDPLYRSCPRCAKLMHRRNYERKSGVILDVCERHGVWFDFAELERLLRWVRDGGERQARTLIREEERQQLRMEVFKREAGAGAVPQAWYERLEEAGPWLGPLLYVAGRFLVAALAKR